MKIAEALRDRSALKALLDPAHPRYVTGSPEEREQARREWQQHRFTAQVMASNLEEIPRAHLELHRFGVVEDDRTGTFYRPRRDGLIDLEFTNAVAYYVDADGVAVLLERPSGPATRSEVEQRRAEREQRRNTPQAAPRVDEPVSDRRDKLWYLINDRGGEVAELEIRLDRADLEIDGLRRIQWEETRDRLQRLGFDVSKYRPPPQLRLFEQRCANHIGPDDDVEALVIAAKERESGRTLDRLYADHVLRPA
jgi:hypothetical protein